MKTVLIDNQTDIAQQLIDEYSASAYIIEAPHRNTYSVISQVDGIVRGIDDDVLLVIKAGVLDCYLKNNQDLWGIDLIKEIRSNRTNSDELRTAHIVIYSFFSLANILDRRPENLIVTSPGVTLTTLSEIRTLDFTALVQQRVTDFDALNPYFRVDFTLPDHRHGYANWWGAYKMCSNYHLLFNDELSKAMFNDLQETKDDQIYSAEFLYGSKVEELPPAFLKKMKSKFDKDRKARDNSWDAVKQMMFNKEIVLIDDQADKLNQDGLVGWKDLYSLFIYGERHLLHSVSVELDDDAIIEKISDHHKLVLLDLYLEEEDHHKNIYQVRGVRLLRKIRKKYPFIPIIITTASNKVITKEKMKELGCDEVWVKEGVDEKLSTADSMKKLLNFFLLIEEALYGRYKLVAQWGRIIKEIEQRDLLWWENHTWIDSDKRKVNVKINRDEIIKILKAQLINMRSFLRRELKSEVHQIKEDDSGWLSGVIVELAKTIEMVHKFHKTTFMAEIMKRREDNLGSLLYQQRHKVAHAQQEGKGKLSVDFAYIKYLLCYLLLGPRADFLRLDPFGGITKGMIFKNDEYKHALKKYFT